MRRGLPPSPHLVCPYEIMIESENVQNDEVKASDREESGEEESKGEDEGSEIEVDSSENDNRTPTDNRVCSGDVGPYMSCPFPSEPYAKAEVLNEDEMEKKGVHSEALESKEANEALGDKGAELYVKEAIPTQVKTMAALNSSTKSWAEVITSGKTYELTLRAPTAR
ncbi:hypothetical protein U1Q18_032786 [Sarracenia purpurea var. burkii]